MQHSCSQRFRGHARLSSQSRGVRCPLRLRPAEMLQPPQNQWGTSAASSWFATTGQLDPFQPGEGKAEAGRAAVRPSSAAEAAGAGPVPADKRKQLHRCSNLCPTASGPGAFLSAGAQPAVTAASFQPLLWRLLLLPAAERDVGEGGPGVGPSPQSSGHLCCLPWHLLARSEPVFQPLWTER